MEQPGNTKQKLVIGILVVIIIATIVLGGIVLISKLSNVNLLDRTGLDTSESRESSNTSNDVSGSGDGSHEFYNYSLPLLISLYRSNNGDYPADNASGWDNFISGLNNKDDANDPATGKPPVFTDDKPEKGEIQYRVGASCSKSASFVSSASSNVFAYRFVAGNRLGCYGNVSGSAYRN